VDVKTRENIVNRRAASENLTDIKAKPQKTEKLNGVSVLLEFLQERLIMTRAKI